MTEIPALSDHCYHHETMPMKTVRKEEVQKGKPVVPARAMLHHLSPADPPVDHRHMSSTN